MFFLASFLVTSVSLSGSQASFNDSESVLGSSVTAGYWDVAPTPTLTPTSTPTATPTPSQEEEPTPTATPTSTPSPTPTEVGPGDVVVNEVMWMGSVNSTADEWIELRNTTSSPIDVGQWTLDNVEDTATRVVHIPGSQNIPANGFLVISNYNKNNANSDLSVDVDVVANLSLLNSGNGHLILKDSDGNIIDQAKGDVWPTGVNSTQKKSMERNDVPGDGLLAASWHTCIDSGCNDGIYWDTSDGNNYGTPGSANLSSLEIETNLDFYLMTGGHALGFRVYGSGVSAFEKFEYKIIYDSDQGSQVIVGTINIESRNEIEVKDILLGTCSEHDICVYNSGINNLSLTVIFPKPFERILYSAI